MEDHLHLYQERLKGREGRWQQSLTLLTTMTQSLHKKSNTESAELKSDSINWSLGIGDLYCGLNLQPDEWVMVLCSVKSETWDLIITPDHRGKNQEVGKKQLGKGNCWLLFLLQWYKHSMGLCKLLTSWFWMITAPTLAQRKFWGCFIIQQDDRSTEKILLDLL